MPTITTPEARSTPRTIRIWYLRCAVSYPTPRVPYEPRYDRSLRTFAEFTPASSASSSEEMLVTSSGRRPRTLR